jgi:hypothetical protein
MKKAIIDQIMLGIFLFAALIVLGATISDEFIARKKSDKLVTLTKDITRALAKYYMYNQNIKEAEYTANNILSSTKLGEEVLSKNLISYVWRDLDGDFEPDVVTTYIAGYEQDNFWFRFVDLNIFTLPPTDATAYVTKEESEIISITLKYGGSNAGYYNMIGTYELDSNNCITNAKLLLVNKLAHEIGDILGNYTNLNTRFFIIPDGYNAYGSKTATLDSYISISGCQNDTPRVTIDSKTDATYTYFQDTYFNTDNGYDHMHEVGKTYFNDYENYINTGIPICTKYRRDNCTSWSTRDATWEDWVEYTNKNNIDFENDPNDEYIITMEDLPNNNDKDFNDINLDTTKIRIPKTIETSEVEYGNII